MEHKKIDGGEQYLPFARSRIKALRATGLRYASQEFMVDGVAIKVQIVGEHNYLDIRGGGTTLLMDSGVVDIVSIVPWEVPTNYLPRQLHEAGSAISYNAPFVVPQGATNFWRLKPGNKNDGQFSGNLKTPSGPFKGRVPKDGVNAASFSPRSIENDANMPPTWEPDPEDGTIVEKKLMATSCPPSMFTGKCRLYVQALYGKHLNKDTTDGAGNVIRGGDQIPMGIYLAPSLGMPYLKLKPYRAKGDETVYADVDLYTGSGVHLDEQTGVHWLLNPFVGVMAAYPLVPSQQAKVLRKYLIPAEHPELSADDREHLEAYILSTCAPDVKNVQFVSIPEVPTYSMGYSWHWNWSGTCADIVHNETIYIGFEGGFDRYGMRSTHRRLTATLSTSNGVSTWSAGVAVVSGPSDWAGNRIFWSVCEPHWGAKAIIPTLPAYSSYREGSATFYAFYLRDDLQLCTVTISKVSGASHRKRSDDAFAGAAFGSPAAQATIGMRDGWFEEYYEQPDSYEATFTCGAKTVSGIKSVYTEVFDRTEVTNKTAGPIDMVPNAYGGVFYGTATIPVGYPDEGTSFTYQCFGGGPRPDLQHTDSQSYSGPMINFDYIQSHHSTRTQGSATVIVPMYDAEAVFFHSTISKEEVITNRELTRRQQNSARTAGVRYLIYIWVSDPEPPEYGGWQFTGTFTQGPKFTWYVYDGIGGVVTPKVNLDPQTINSTIEDFQVLVCRAGIVDADLSMNLTYYHGDEFAPPCSAWSSTSTTDPVVFSPGKIDPVGTDIDSSLAVIVGWI